MSRALALSLPELGHLYPLVPTLLELEGRGHDTLVVTGPKHAALPRGAGLAVWEVTTEVDGPREAWERRNPLRGGKEGAVGYLPIAEEVACRLEAVVADWKPDVVLADPLWWPAVTVAEAAGCPWALFAHSPIFIPSRRRRPLMGDHRPLARPLGILRDRLAWTLARRRTRHAAWALNVLRSRRGLAPLGDAFAYLARAPLVLAYAWPELADPNRRWLPSVRFVGPTDWEQPATPPQWLGDLDDGPLILGVTSSTSQADRRIVEVLLEAMADEYVQVVATIPSGELPDGVPPNARVEGFVPHSLVLPKAACVVCHGGLGIVQKALGAGVPLVVVPFGRDQHHNARRLVALGVGVRLPPEHLSPERLRRAIDRTTALRPRAERLSRALGGFWGASVAADTLEEYLGTGPSAGPIVERRRTER